ncbi:hypothetical protein E8E14_012494 [Neopestalotiopsis sp. 37M]|nr:hypothetical protein E8E14_012494 [Neopestalotiopsis sp. 37M]
MSSYPKNSDDQRRVDVSEDNNRNEYDDDPGLSGSRLNNHSQPPSGYLGGPGDYKPEYDFDYSENGDYKGSLHFESGTPFKPSGLWKKGMSVQDYDKAFEKLSADYSQGILPQADNTNPPQSPILELTWGDEEEEVMPFEDIDRSYKSIKERESKGSMDETDKRLLKLYEEQIKQAKQAQSDDSSEPHDCSEYYGISSSHK